MGDLAATAELGAKYREVIGLAAGRLKDRAQDVRGLAAKHPSTYTERDIRLLRAVLLYVAARTMANDL